MTLDAATCMYTHQPALHYGMGQSKRGLLSKVRYLLCDELEATETVSVGNIHIVMTHCLSK